MVGHNHIGEELRVSSRQSVGDDRDNLVPHRFIEPVFLALCASSEVKDCTGEIRSWFSHARRLPDPPGHQNS